MATKIKLTAGLYHKKHCYYMEIFQGAFPVNVVNIVFEGTELGWLQAQTTIDNFKDSLTEVEVIDETGDPR